MQFIGGVSQQEYVEQTRGLDPSRCLAAGIDVGKYEAVCLIADHHGEVVGKTLTFPLTEPGVRALEAQLAAAVAASAGVSVRIGLETAGHYHRTVVDRLVASGHDVFELNPLMSRRHVPSKARVDSRPICLTLLRASTWSSVAVGGRRSSGPGSGLK